MNSADLDAVGEYPNTWQQQLESAAAKVDPTGYRTANHFIAAFERRYGPCSLATALGVLHQISVHQEDISSFLHEDAFATSIKVTIEAPLDALDDPDLADLPAHLRRITDVEVLLFIIYLLNLPPLHPQADEARMALTPLLESRSASLRWASTMSLGHLRDERAFPRLLSMLIEGMPEPEPWFATGETERQQRWEQFSLDAAHVDMIGHYDIPEILWRWGDRRAIPALRAAFARTIRIEQTEARWDPIRRWAMNWQWYRDRLLYALGRFEAFGILAGIEPPEEVSAPTVREIHDPPHEEAQRFRSWVDRGSVYALWGWQVALCYAAVDAYTDADSKQRIELRAPRRRTRNHQPERRVEIDRLLMEQFGLGEAEREIALQLFLDSRIDFTR